MNDNELIPNSSGEDIQPKIKPVLAGILGLLIVFFLYFGGGTILTLAVVGFDLQKADNLSVKLLTAAGQILFILLPALILSKSIYENVTFIIRVRKPRLGILVLFVIGLIPVSLIIQSYMYIQDFVMINLAKSYPFIDNAKKILDKFDETTAQSYASFLSANSIIDYISVFLVVTIIPAVCEEFFFRGYVLKSFEFKYSPFISALFTSLFFSMYHIYPYQFIPLSFLGLYLGIAAYMSDSIVVPVVIHFLNNTIAIIMFFAGSPDDINSTGDISFNSLKTAVMIFIVGILLLTALFFYMKRFYKLKQS